MNGEVGSGVRLPRALAGFGSGWALLFATAHFYWAAGGRVGVGAAAGPIGNRPWFLAYDLAAAVVFVTGCVIGVVLASGAGSARMRGRLLVLTFWAAVLGLVRGAVGLVQDGITAALGHPLDIGVLYDAWFAVAGIVFLIATRGLRAAVHRVAISAREQGDGPGPKV
jgi:hypothetical protein